MWVSYGGYFYLSLALTKPLPFWSLRMNECFPAFVYSLKSVPHSQEYA